MPAFRRSSTANCRKGVGRSIPVPPKLQLNPRHSHFSRCHRPRSGNGNVLSVSCFKSKIRMGAGPPFLAMARKDLVLPAWLYTLSPALPQEELQRTERSAGYCNPEAGSHTGFGSGNFERPIATFGSTRTNSAGPGCQQRSAGWSLLPIRSLHWRMALLLHKTACFSSASGVASKCSMTAFALRVAGMQAMELSTESHWPHIQTQRPSHCWHSAECLSTLLYLPVWIGSSDGLSSASHLGALPGPSWR